MVDALMALLRLLAIRHEVTAVTLATRRDLEALVRGERDLPLLQGWRRGLAGTRVLEFLDGGGALRVRDGMLEWHAAPV
jgi:ribonuclease D